MKLKTSLTQSQKSKVMPEYRILGGRAVVFILGPIMAFIVLFSFVKSLSPNFSWI